MKDRAKVGILTAFTLLCCVAVWLSCRRDAFVGKDVPATELLRRSAIASWQTKRSLSSGIEIDVPTDLCGFFDEPSLGLQIELHTLPPPAGVLDDKKCLLQIQIERMSKEKFQRQRASDPAGHTGDPPKSRSWTYSRHDSVSRFDDGQYTYYRYDVGCPNTDVVSSLATVRNIFDHGVSLYEKEDDSTVRRILGSLRCLDAPARRTEAGALPQ